MDWQVAIAAWGAILSTFLVVVRFLEFRRDRIGLTLSVATALAAGSAELALGTDKVLTASVVNSGSRPVGVSSLGLALTGGNYIPFVERFPTGDCKPLPGVLGPQEKSTYWLNYDSLVRQLRNEGLRIRQVMVFLADGRTMKQDVPKAFRVLGD